MIRDQKKIVHVSWLDFHHNTIKLVKRFKNPEQWKGIIAITRGGLVPSVIVACELNIRFIDTICLSSYDNNNSQADIQILKTLNGENKEEGKGLIVLDDLVDSGRTLRVVHTMLPKAHYAVVYAKPQGKDMIDTFGVEVEQNTWLVFPWEISAQS